MTVAAWLPPVAILMLLACVSAALAWGPLQRQDRLERRIDRLRASAGISPGAGGSADHAAWPGHALAFIGRGLTRSGILSSKAIADLEHTLASAGMRTPRALPIFVGVKGVLLALLPLLAISLLHASAMGAIWRNAAVAVAALAGLMGPDIILRGVRGRYLASVERAMPDALDLMVICSEAGLSLEAGMERVAHEIRVSSPACAVELSVTHNELRIHADRRAALVNMGRRTGLENLKRLSATLAQAMQYGTPLSQALRTLSADMRTEALTRFEARAARLPVLMTLPMILFILPCVFLIVAGPAMVTLLTTLGR